MSVAAIVLTLNVSGDSLVPEADIALMVERCLLKWSDPKLIALVLI